MSYNSLREVSLAKGYWLAGLPAPYANAFFDITDISSYPFPLDSQTKFQLSKDLRELHTVSVQLKAVVNEDSALRLDRILTTLRNKCDEISGFKAVIPTFATPYRYTGDIPKDVLAKRLFFLHIAKLVVAGNESYSSAAAKYGLDKVNVIIWVSLYLTHGESLFLHHYETPDRDKEFRIAKSHIDNHSSVVVTCVNNMIFCRKRLKNILRRYKNSS